MTKLKLIGIEFSDHDDRPETDERLIISGRFFGEHSPVSPFITFGTKNRKKIIFTLKTDRLGQVIVNEFCYRVCGTPCARFHKFTPVTVSDADTFKLTLDIHVHGLKPRT
jgi:hypothetical protein